MLARERVYIWVSLLVVIHWISVVSVEPRGIVALGYFLGTLSGCATLAATWTALGPGRMIWRIPLSMVWIVFLLVAVGLNISMHAGPRNGVFVVGVLMLVQWLLTQVPLWSLYVGFGFQLRYRDDIPTQTDASSIRFGIRDLFITMAIVGVLLGIGRVIVANIDITAGGEVYAFVLLGIAGVVMMFPLVVAVLMQRWTIPAIGLSLVSIAAATFAEIPVFAPLGPGPNIEHFIGINTASAIIILIIAGVVRLNGYSLQRLANRLEV